VSIALFFLLSGFFLSTLLGVLQHSRRLLGAAATCSVAVACVIVFLTPVQLPSWGFGSRSGGAASTSTTTTATGGPVVGTTAGEMDDTAATDAARLARRVTVETMAASPAPGQVTPEAMLAR
jgi:hypothetical protein